MALFTIFTRSALLLCLGLSIMAAPLLRDYDIQLSQRTTGTHTGSATWYMPGNGNCGNWDTKDDPIVAISTQIYNNGAYCNRWIHIFNPANSKSTYAQVRDSCPGCDSNHIDLSPKSFQSLAPLNDGVIKNIQWNFMPTGYSA